jgi:EAL domain-containing protein (putative c-di-GMP-specific phosphodiesterase class I)
MTTADYSTLAPDDGGPLDPLQFAFASRDRDVLTMVRASLAAGHAQLAFQPVIAAGTTGAIAFYEGLIRLRDNGGRVIPAHQFVETIEDTDLGREIDCASLRLGFDMLAANPNLRLSINMSARSIADGDWRRIMDRRLKENPRLGERLILEISETSAMLLHEVVIRFMAEMQPRGVAFALDDFGGGMTAFRHLKDFFFDMVKIDRCFIRDIDALPDNQVLTEALITVAHQFEMFAVAEGVETEAELLLLQSLGIDCLQGYYFGVPKFAL